MSGKAEWMEGLSQAEVFAEALFSHGCAYGTVALMEELHETAESLEAFEFIGVAPIVPRWTDTAVGITATFDDGSVMTFSTGIENGERCAIGAWETLSAGEWDKARRVAEEFKVVWADASDSDWIAWGSGRGAGGGDGFQPSAVCDSCHFDLPFLFDLDAPDDDTLRTRFVCHLCLTDEDYYGAS